MVNELKDILAGFYSGLDEAEKRIRAEELTQSEQQKDKRMKNGDDRLRDLGSNIKWTNIAL